MSEQNKFQKKPLIEEAPQIFPELTKVVLNLDEYISSQPSIKQLGNYAIHLYNLNKKSIYKKLLSNIKNKESPEMKEIRNKYLKKLVESNQFFFPKELGLDEYKKPFNSKEERLKKLLKHLEEEAKKEQIKLDLKSRKNSNINVVASRKESLIDNKRKRLLRSNFTV